MPIQNLTDTNYLQEIQKIKGKAILEIYGENCQPCKKLAPIFEEVAKKYESQMEFFKVEAYQNPQIASRFGIRSVPSIILLKDSKILSIRSGTMSAKELEKLVIS